MKRFLVPTFALAIGLFSVSGGATAADYPSRPVSFVVGFPAGQMIDLLSRVVAEGLSEQLESSFVVKNSPGQGGSIALGQLKDAKPDGYTMGVAATAALAINPHLYGDAVNYKPLKDFRYAGTLGQIPFVMVTHVNSPFHTLEDVVKYAKQHPLKLTYSSPGNGTMPHLGMLQLQKKLNVELTHVPYKGSPRAIQDLSAGLIDVAFDTQAITQPMVEAGKLRLLAVTSKERLESLPNIPTMIEAGVPDFTLAAWFALVLPTGTPDKVIAALNDALRAIMEKDKTLAAVKRTGATALTMTPQETQALAQRDFEAWGPIVKAAAAQVD